VSTPTPTVFHNTVADVDALELTEPFVTVQEVADAPVKVNVVDDALHAWFDPDMLAPSGPFTVMVCVVVPLHVVDAVSISFNDAVETLLHTMVTVFPVCELIEPPVGTHI
jgi:hypothetical protein